jgi:tRNA (guanine-N(7)-)-methyltransferase subunit TRM82
MSVKTGFQKVAICGDILFAANGPNIHSFSASSGAHLSSWTYPHPWLTRKDATVKVDSQGGARSAEPTDKPAIEAPATQQDEPETVEDGPPSKRRKVGAEPGQEVASKKDETNVDGGGKEPAANGQEDAKKDTAGKGKGPKAKKEKAKGNGKDYGLGFGKQKAVLDIPMFQCMTTTSDGKYLVGVIGSTKTIWTFEHDGNGKLTELSQRPMPKRPCSIVIAGDDKTILSADKFGDVYALPVVQGQEPSGDVSTSQEGTPTPSTPSTPQPFKYQANPLTVHTRRNLLALENQKRQAEQQIGFTEKSTPQLDFEHKLVLGHVSMLTDMVLGSHEGKEYIITADRDEHIRVSRGLPQAHIIENYCLGHKEFVSVLHIPETHPHLLISGGGDDHLYVWDWYKGELLQKIPVGYSAESRSTGSPNLPVLPVAVSGIASFDRERYTVVGVVCEKYVPPSLPMRIPTDLHLQFLNTLQIHPRQRRRAQVQQPRRHDVRQLARSSRHRQRHLRNSGPKLV